MKTIIIYSTKYGSVAKAAEKLKKELNGEVVIADVKTNPDFSGFDKVILAGSVYVGKVQKSMRDFVSQRLSDLREKDIGLFICAGDRKEENISSYIAKSFTQELHDKAIAKANLGYEYDLKKFSFFDRLIVRIVGVKKSEYVFFEDKIKDFAGLINKA
jgi:menaquinone-dependent protoporphyrinogen oxidase